MLVAITACLNGGVDTISLRASGDGSGTNMAPQKTQDDIARINIERAKRRKEVGAPEEGEPNRRFLFPVFCTAEIPTEVHP
jgi:hypothetical protein